MLKHKLLPSVPLRCQWGKRHGYLTSVRWNAAHRLFILHMLVKTVGFYDLQTKPWWIVSDLLHLIVIIATNKIHVKTNRKALGGKTPLCLHKYICPLNTTRFKHLLFVIKHWAHHSVQTPETIVCKNPRSAVSEMLMPLRSYFCPVLMFYVNMYLHDFMQCSADTWLEHCRNMQVYRCS